MIKKGELFLTTRDYFLSKHKFDISQTSMSGVLITTPQPRDLDTYYDTLEYLSHDDTDNSLFARCYRFARKLNIRAKFKLISKYDADHPVLDVGAGNGELVKYLVDRRLDAQGFEPSVAARKVAYQKGVRLLDHLPIRNKNYYQVIQMFHVLEHVKDPIKTISDLHSMLRHDGILIIALPNYKSFDAYLFGEHWAGFDVPRHLFHFEKKGVQELTKEKFDLLQTKPMWFDSIYVSILSSRYKKWPVPFISGILIGIVSNLAAIFTSEPSSRIYVFKKTNKAA